MISPLSLPTLLSFAIAEEKSKRGPGTTSAVDFDSVVQDEAELAKLGKKQQLQVSTLASSGSIVSCLADC